MNTRHFRRGSLLLVSVLALGAPAAQAQFFGGVMPVIDATSILQLINQLNTLRQQLDQAKTAFDSMTGPRGMEQLLAGTVRNYLPANWQELTDSLTQAQGAYAALSGDLRAAVADNAVLSDTYLARLPPEQRREIEAARQSAAMLQALTHQALGSTSARFDSLQGLIAAIGSAGDQKAILDLQARIGGEHDMLVNEGTKLQALYQTTQAEEAARHQREREQVLASIGSLRDLPPMGLPAP